ncbi:hypothetical protein Pint_05170 [Pistacia integerrima]|uniref:Uncharacterized protein n=1 Tax=Pistacia integerrima TaxID=434235 RepID=A0ACC0Z5X6_9ROSI|nr:hypothetical protein Pint_05170 [Pistacia integerrima]
MNYQGHVIFQFIRPLLVQSNFLSPWVGYMKFHLSQKLHICCRLQSSCTKPDFEAESAQMEEMQDFSRQVWGKSLQNDVKMPTHEGSINYSQQIGGSVVAAYKDANDRNLGKDVEPESQMKGCYLH